MSNDLKDDEGLFSGFDALVPPIAASQRGVEQTRQLLLAPDLRPAFRMRPIAAYCAAAALLVSVLAVCINLTHTPRNETDTTKDVSQQQNSQRHIAGSDSVNAGGPPGGGREE